MRAVGLAWAPPLAGDQAAVRKRASEGMSDWCRGGPVGTGGRPYRRGALLLLVVVVDEDEDGVGSRSSNEETLLLRGAGTAGAAVVVVDVDAAVVERAGGE